LHREQLAADGLSILEARVANMGWRYAQCAGNEPHRVKSRNSLLADLEEGVLPPATRRVERYLLYHEVIDALFDCAANTWQFTREIASGQLNLLT
jgi:hypothetical protein